MDPQYIFIYLVFINLFAVYTTIKDKICAKKHKWRIKESTLIIVSAAGGSICMYLTMLIIRHKTGHLKFMLGIPLIIMIQCIAIYLIWRKING